MMCAARLSESACGLATFETKRLGALISAAKLPTSPPPIASERWLELMQRDKKVQSGELRFVLLQRLGQAVVRANVPQADVRETLAHPKAPEAW
jgi:3-dehydroquinate synthase